MSISFSRQVVLVAHFYRISPDVPVARQIQMSPLPGKAAITEPVKINKVKFHLHLFLTCLKEDNRPEISQGTRQIQNHETRKYHGAPP
jgi:hypothetical protein